MCLASKAVELLNHGSANVTHGHKSGLKSPVVPRVVEERGRLGRKGEIVIGVVQNRDPSRIERHQSVIDIEWLTKAEPLQNLLLVHVHTPIGIFS